MKTTLPKPLSTAAWPKGVPPPDLLSGPGRRLAAFTMVEIAISIAVVGIALVAIIGILPTGFDVQTKNRQNTLINQEGNFWVEAIRGGALGLDYLTNTVDLVTITNFDSQARPVPPPRFYAYGAGYRDGRDIVGLLTQPPFHPKSDSRYMYYPRVTAYVRSMTGSAGEKTPKNDFAFSYRLTTELAYYQPYGLGLTNPVTLTNFTAANLSDAERQLRAQRFDVARKAEAMQASTYELRLALEWPVFNMGSQVRVGNNRKTFRALISGALETTNDTRLGRLNWLRSREHINQP
jgi:hypothetical protein